MFNSVYILCAVSYSCYGTWAYMSTTFITLLYNVPCRTHVRVLHTEYGAQMKAWNNDWRPDRWVKQIHKHRMPYLRAYAPPRASSYEGKVIQAKVP